jgi:porin
VAHRHGRNAQGRGHELKFHDTFLSMKLGPAAGCLRGLSRGKDIFRAYARNVRVLTKSSSRSMAKLLPKQCCLRKSPVAAALLGWLAASVFAESPAAAQDALQGIAGNPGAVDVEPGTGELGRLIGFGPDSGVRLGGVLVSNGNYLASGGNSPGVASFNNLLVTGLNADLEKLIHIPGATVGAALLQFDGQPTNQQAGVVTGYNSLPGAPPLDRTEFYELWWRQSLFSDAVVVRFGKLVPTNDFDNVVRPVPVQDPSLNIPAVSGLLYTPIFVNPTILGFQPGYYNSAYGVTATLAPSKSWYLSLGTYDGNGARGVQTGLETLPTFNGYRFQIGEIGAAWLLGAQGLPGSFAVGAWDQTGQLTLKEYPTGFIAQDGAQGVYMFASQRLWRDPEGDGVSGFIQFGANDSRTTLFANRYFGLGLTGFGLIPGRPGDSLGAGLAWSALNQNRSYRGNEVILQAYYQIQVKSAFYLEPALTLSTPGERSAAQPTLAFTLQSTILF